VPGFKRVPLEPGPLGDLMDALHQLHLAAGYPSTRDLQRDIGGRDAPSHAAIHKAFTGSKPPTWRLVEPVVRAMARRANRDGQAEVERFRDLWAKAHQGNVPIEPETDRSTLTAESQIVSKEFSRPISDLLLDALNEIEAVGANDTTGTFRIPTGFADLDALLGGWSQGYLIVVGGRPSSGKTNLLLNFCRVVSMKYRLPTMLISGEMNSREIQTRLVSAEARVPLHILRTGQMSDDDWGRLAREIKVIADSPIHIATPPDFGMEQVVGDVNRLVGEVGLKLLVIDSLQWITESEASAQISVEFILRRLKKLAETARIPIIVTSSAEKRGQAWDPISQLMHSAAIERVADVVILLDRADQDERETPYAGEANLVVLKNRNGPTATVTVACQLHYCRFVDMGPSEYLPGPTEYPYPPIELPDYLATREEPSEEPS
jgi:replicative DNA helicase